MRYKIGDFLKRVRVPVQIEDGKLYKRVTIKIKHQGISVRDEVFGIEIGTKSQFIVKEGLFLMSKIDARYGAFGIIPSEVDGGIITGNFWAYEVDKSVVNIECFNLFISSQSFYDICEKASSGTTHRKYISEDIFLNLEIELPIFTDQLKLVEDFKCKKINFITLQTELKTQATLLTQLRQAYLQEAVMGQLTASTTDDAHTLLADIKAQKAQLIKEGKLRKEKPLPPIKPEEIPFEIPENWVWCRLGEVIILGSGQDLQPHEYSDIDNEGLPYITGASNLEDEKVIINRWTKTPKSIASRGDLLLTCKGSGVGKMAWLDEEKVHIARQIMSIRSSFVDTRYIKFILQLNAVKYRANAKSLIPGIDRNTVLLTLISLPPLSEQQAIVAKVAGLLEKVSALEAENKAQQAELERLMSAVLQEAFSSTVFQTVQEA